MQHCQAIQRLVDRHTVATSVLNAPEPGGEYMFQAREHGS